MRDISEKRFQKPKEIPLCIYSKYIPPAPSPVYPAPLPLPLSFAARRVLIGGELQMPGKYVIPPITEQVLYSELLRDLP
jgi:hypothetical protein